MLIFCFIVFWKADCWKDAETLGLYLCGLSIFWAFSFRSHASTDFKSFSVFRENDLFGRPCKLSKDTGGVHLELEEHSYVYIHTYIYIFSPKFSIVLRVLLMSQYVVSAMLDIHLN